MILIVGSNHDDVLYYESLLKNPREEVVLNHYHLIIGTIASEEVMVVQDVYTSYVSGILASYLINKYVISLVINVGRCELVRGGLKVGDIVVSEANIFADVDQINIVKGTELGQIPNHPRVFHTPLPVLNTMNNCLKKVSSHMHYGATFLSSSFFRQNKEYVRNLEKDTYVQSLSQNIVLDGESSGIHLACFLNDIPAVTVKVVEAKYGEYTTLDHYLLILEEYASLGKAIANFIGEISRTDMERM